MDKNICNLSDSRLLWRILANHFERRIARIHTHLLSAEIRPQGGFSIRFQEVVRAFCEGFRSPLELDGTDGSPSFIQDRGFRIEGFAMREAMRDAFSVSPQRVAVLLSLRSKYPYTIHVGAGWACARLPFIRKRLLDRLDPMLRWLAYDGWGFHDALFNPAIFLRGHSAPTRLVGYERRAWDQGAGRCAWFALGADSDEIGHRLGEFPQNRQADLWSGIGLAATYAGGSDADGLQRLRQMAGEHRKALAQGSCFAAKARAAAECVPDHTELACAVLCDLSAQKASHLTDRCLSSLPEGSPDMPAYEHWRRRIQDEF